MMYHSWRALYKNTPSALFTPTIPIPPTPLPHKISKILCISCFGTLFHFNLYPYYLPQKTLYNLILHTLTTIHTNPTPPIHFYYSTLSFFSPQKNKPPIHINQWLVFVQYAIFLFFMVLFPFFYLLISRFCDYNIKFLFTKSIFYCLIDNLVVLILYQLWIIFYALDVIISTNVTI